MNALVFGEVLWDVYPTSKHIGGASMNFAAHLKKGGAEAHIVTAVGDDSEGREAVDKILEFGIGAEYVTVSKTKQTGKCIVTLDENRIPSYDLLDDVAYDDTRKPELRGKPFDVLYFGTLALRNENNLSVVKQIISENKFDDVFVDMNIRPPYYSEYVIRFALGNATIVKISDEELPLIMRALGKEQLSLIECAKALGCDFGNLKMMIITMGDKGSFVYDMKNGKIHEITAKKVQVVSTVGAGDSFSAAFLTKYMKTKNIADALSLATNISAFVVSCKDAIPEYEMSDFDKEIIK